MQTHFMWPIPCYVRLAVPIIRVHLALSWACVVRHVPEAMWRPVMAGRASWTNALWLPCDDAGVEHRSVMCDVPMTYEPNPLSITD